MRWGTFCTGILFGALMSSVAARASVPVIGPTLRNGSFEDATVAPWQTDATFSLTRLQDPALAADGVAIGQIDKIATRR